MLAVVIASGSSLNDSDIDSVRLAYHSGVIDIVVAVSNVGIDKAPWATALASHDYNWWDAHPEAQNFTGRKFSRNGRNGTEWLDVTKMGMPNGINSGLFGMVVAKYLGAEKIILLGFDLHNRAGAHYFGKHERSTTTGMKLNNTHADRFPAFIAQFNRFDGCEVVNCTQGSDLKRFPFMTLREALC